MFFSFYPAEILHVSSMILLYVFRFNFSFCVNNGLEKKSLKEKHQNDATDVVLVFSLLTLSIFHTFF